MHIITRHAVVVLFFIALIGSTSFTGQALNAQPASYSTVVATVGIQQITQGEVNSFLKKRFGEREFDKVDLAKIQSAALDHLIDRRIIYDFLSEKGYAPGKNQVALEVGRFEDELKTTDRTLPQFLDENEMTFEHFQFEAAWRLGWQKYLDEKVTDLELESFYDQNRKDFDGTRLQVAQILKSFPPNTEDREKFVQESIASLNETRIQVLSGEMNWNDAVKSSDAPSKKDQGLVGWIGIDGPMPPTFTAAAFKLKTGEISEPIPSSFGVHLIRCIAIEPGNKGFRDVYPIVREAVYKHRFNLIVEYQRPKVEIKITR